MAYAVDDGVAATIRLHTDIVLLAGDETRLIHVINGEEATWVILVLLSNQ